MARLASELNKVRKDTLTRRWTCHPDTQYQAKTPNPTRCSVYSEVIKVVISFAYSHILGQPSR